jgi:3-deoxy-manno-octulosonate cytidylyltransferase (CMP-KDO synthetase)
MRDFVVVIPARLDSGRLGRKPLADICGKPMILHTYERALEATSSENIFVATDSREILEVCETVNANCLITPKDCLTGTDRIAHFSKKILAKTYVNLQGDEPLMDSSNISKMIFAAKTNPEVIINGWASIKTKKDYFSKTIPKVILNSDNDLLYMSRSPVPGNKQGVFCGARKQVCVYSFPYSALQFILINSTKTLVEEIEDIEILRFLEMGWKIKMIELPGLSVAVDTPADLDKVRKKMGHYKKRLENRNINKII